MSQEPRHRYEGITVADLPGRVLAELHSLAAYPRSNAPATSADDELRLLATQNPQAAAVYGLACAQAHRVAPLDPQGRPLEASTRDVHQLVAWWNGAYKDSWPGVPCEPGTFYALAVWGTGLEWLREISTLKHLTRSERIAAWLAGRGESASTDAVDAVTELGVPPGAGDDDRDHKPDEPRATVAGLLRLVEHREPDMRQVIVGVPYRGEILGPEGQRALQARRKAPALMQWLVWEWPVDVELPMGHLRTGVRAVAALPAENALLDLGDGITWRCQQFPPLTSPPPDWLIAKLQKFMRTDEVS